MTIDEMEKHGILWVYDGSTDDCRPATLDDMATARQLQRYHVRLIAVLRAIVKPRPDWSWDERTALLDRVSKAIGDDT